MVDCLFTFNQPVKLTGGFHRGEKGRVQELITPKKGSDVIKYKVKISSVKQPLEVEETDLKALILGLF